MMIKSGKEWVAPLGEGATPDAVAYFIFGPPTGHRTVYPNFLCRLFNIGGKAKSYWHIDG